MLRCYRNHLASRISLGLLSLLCWSGAIGCSALPSTADKLAQFNSPTPEAAATASNAAEVKLEVRPENRSPKSAQVPLEQVTHAQGALDYSRSMKKFRRSAVEIYRPTPNGPYLRMPCRIDPRTKRISTDTDYALHPGDYVVVSEVPFTMWDEMMQHATGPLKVLRR
jgi:hypothetical protein